MTDPRIAAAERVVEAARYAVGSYSVSNDLVTGIGTPTVMLVRKRVEDLAIAIAAFDAAQDTPEGEDGWERKHGDLEEAMTTLAEHGESLEAANKRLREALRETEHALESIERCLSSGMKYVQGAPGGWEVTDPGVAITAHAFASGALAAAALQENNE